MLATIENWYDQPTGYVDPIDIEEHGKHAITLLKDLIVIRTVEMSVLRRLFFRALKKPIHLLPSQEITFKLAQEAKHLNITESTYIAQQLGISRIAAWKRLETLNTRLAVIEYQFSTKTLTYDDNSCIYNEQSPIKQDDTTTDRIAAGLTFDCPTQPYTREHFKTVKCTGTASGRFGICHACSGIYGKNKAERTARGYSWVNDLVASVKEEARNDAKNMQFISVSEIY